MVWQLLENEVKENNQLYHPCTGKTSQLIQNTWASDFCQKRLAILYCSFCFVPYIFCMLREVIFGVQDEE